MQPVYTSRAWQGRARDAEGVLDAYNANDAAKALEVWTRRDASTTCTQPVPRAAHLHDGGCAQHHAVQASPLHRQNSSASATTAPTSPKTSTSSSRAVSPAASAPRAERTSSMLSPPSSKRRTEGPAAVAADRALVKPLVLIVEDEQALVTLLRYNFEAAGYEVAIALDGDEALMAVSERRPDLIVLDGCCTRSRASKCAARSAARPRRGRTGDHADRAQRRGDACAASTAAPRLRHQAVLATELVARVRACCAARGPRRRGGALLRRHPHGPGRASRDAQRPRVLSVPPSSACCAISRASGPRLRARAAARFGLGPRCLCRARTATSTSAVSEGDQRPDEPDVIRPFAPPATRLTPRSLEIAADWPQD